MKLNRQLLLIMLIFLSLNGKAQTNGRAYAELPTIFRNEYLQNKLYFFSDSAFNGSINIFCILHKNDGDSLTVFNRRSFINHFNQGLNKITVAYKFTDTNSLVNSEYYHILQTIKSIPPGTYTISVVITDTLNKKAACFEQLQSIDSTLTPGSLLRSEINSRLLSANPKWYKGNIAKQVKGYGSVKAL